MRHQPQAAVMAFRERGQAFDPVAVVGVDQAVSLDQRCAMDMAADDAVESAPLRIVQASLHIARDVALGRATAALEEFRQRPVALTAALTQQVEPAVAAEDAVVEPVAELLLQA